jgi:hypothetical protein
MSSANAVVYEKKALPGTVATTGIALLVVGLLLGGVSFMMDPLRTQFASIMLFMFLAGVGVCALFMIAIEYITGAVWSVPLRRIFEITGSTVLFLPVFAVPALLGMNNLYEWTNMGTDEVLLRKAPYLNQPFFLIRFAVILGLWMLFYKLFSGNSRKQDTTGDQTMTSKNIKLGAMFIPVFGLSITALSIDFVMSLEPHWFSTMFGVNFFAGSLISSLAVLTITCIMLNESGYLVKGIIGDHYYSLGFGMFAGTVFWTYTAFSQCMLIWYANQPEETTWFIHRWGNGWWVVSSALIIIQFVIPFFGLIQRKNKRNPSRMLAMSMWLIFAHCFDLYWMVMPVYDQVQAKANHVAQMGPTISWAEVAMVLIAAGFLITHFQFKAKKLNLVAVGDPKLQRGINFRL